MALKVSLQDFLQDSSNEHLRRPVDKRSDIRWQSYLMARKIRELRKARGLTQQQLADFVGVNEAAIRNYESQKASPKKQHIERMAEALDVRAEALMIYDFGVGDSVTANSLFQVAEIYGLVPCACQDYAYLKPVNDFMGKALEEWAERYEDYEKGSGEDAAYQLWKDCYTQAYDPHNFPSRYIADETGALSLKENWEASCLSAKLKRLRAERDMAQPAFAELLGIKLGVYRSYEQGWRLPKVSVVEGMASRLGVTPGCLTFFDFGSPVQAIHALFQLASEYGLRPDIVEGQPILRTQTAGLEQIIDQWREASEKFSSDSDRFVSWKDHYDPNADDNRLGYSSRYVEAFSDNEGHIIPGFSAYDPYDARFPQGYLPA